VSERPTGSPGPADGTPPTTTSADAWAAGPLARSTAPRAGPDGDGAAGSGSDRGGPEKKKQGPIGFLLELPVLVLLAFGLALLIKTFLVQAFYIPSESMLPTLEPGDRVLVNKLAYRFGDIRRGDVIVFESPRPSDEPDRDPISAFFVWLSRGLGVSPPADEDFIKRVIGLPGETVEIRRNGVVLIDGQRLDEPYLTGSVPGAWGPERVPEGMLFVLGDNRGNSNDSRFGTLGYIPVDRVVGRAFVRIWPPSRIGWLRGGEATISAATSGSSEARASA
jgi:signal peptidase I